MRKELDERLRKIEGLAFFISTLTGTKTNSKKDQAARPGVAHFVVFRKNSKANETSIFKCLHDSGVDANLAEIQCRKKSFDEKMKIVQGLKQVIKVHIFLIYLY